VKGQKNRYFQTDYLEVQAAQDLSQHYLLELLDLVFWNLWKRCQGY